MVPAARGRPLGLAAELVRERELNPELAEGRVEPEEIFPARDRERRAVIRLLRDDPCVALEVHVAALRSASCSSVESSSTDVRSAARTLMQQPCDHSGRFCDGRIWRTRSEGCNTVAVTSCVPKPRPGRCIDSFAMSVKACPALVGTASRSIANVLATVPGWWARRAVEVGLPPCWRDWESALGQPPAPLSGSPCEHLYDASAVAMGEAYVRASDPSTRLREGRHYTPAVLAEVLWAEIAHAGHKSGLTVDPACGAGALLLQPLRRFVEASTDEPAVALDAARRLIVGTDLDPAAVWLGNALLAAELLPLWARLAESERVALPELLRVADGLVESGEPPEVIVMNPPYGRVRLDASARARWEDSLYGHANRYAIFLHAAIDRVAPGGLVAAVVPTSFLGGSYYQRLRALISERAPLERLTFVDSRAGVFAGGVLQETCIAVLRRGAKARPIRSSRLTMNGSVKSTQLPRAPSPTRPDRPWVLPRQAWDGPLVVAASKLRSRLADYGWKATTGPLVWNRHKTQIAPSPGPGRLPILWAADLEKGTIRRSPSREHMRWIALRDQDEFMKLTEPAVLVQRTTAPEQPRRLVVARLGREILEEWGGEVVVENHVNVLRCSRLASPLTADLLARLLQMPTFDRLYRCLSGTVAVSSYELEALPFPPTKTLVAWDDLSESDLEGAVVSYYGNGTR